MIICRIFCRASEPVEHRSPAPADFQTQVIDKKTQVLLTFSSIQARLTITGTNMRFYTFRLGLVASCDLHRLKEQCKV